MTKMQFGCTYITGFFSGILLWYLAHLWIQYQKDERLTYWDGYLSSMVEIDLISRDGGNPNRGLVTRNGEYFNGLIQIGELVPFYYNWEDSEDMNLVNEFTVPLGDFGRVITWRGGSSLLGGQWPVGVEYVLATEYKKLPAKLRQDPSSN